MEISPSVMQRLTVAIDQEGMLPDGDLPQCHAAPDCRHRDKEEGMLPDGYLPQCHAVPDCRHRTKKGCFPMEISPSVMQCLTVAIEPRRDAS